MNRRLIATLFFAAAAAGYAQTISGLCVLSESRNGDKPETAHVMLSESNCDKSSKQENCMEMSNSGLAWRRWTGVSPQALQAEGTTLSAHLAGEAGELVCDGTVHEGALAGSFRFKASAGFVQAMAGLGFDGITPHRQLSFLMLDVTPPWTREMQALGVTELTTSKLSGLRALGVDSEYVRGMKDAGYPELPAGKLTEMKAVGVTPEKARDARAMGFRPTEQELIQMSIFKVDRAFVERMRARGLQDVTLAKLIKIKVFKLED